MQQQKSLILEHNSQINITYTSGFYIIYVHLHGVNHKTRNEMNRASTAWAS